MEKYSEELKKDLELDSTILKRKQQERPQILVKWLWRLNKAKRDFHQMEIQQEAFLEALKDQYRAHAPTSMSDMALQKVVTKDSAAKKYEEDLNTLKLDIDWLNTAVDAVKAFAFDVKNLIEIIKMETI